MDIARDATIGQKYDPIFKIDNEADAAAYFEKCVEHTMGWGKDRAEAERIEKINIGYYAGYGSSADRHRIEKLFNCSHPVFGSISAVGAPTAEEALQEGQRIAKSEA